MSNLPYLPSPLSLWGFGPGTSVAGWVRVAVTGPARVAGFSGEADVDWIVAQALCGVIITLCCQKRRVQSSLLVLSLENPFHIHLLTLSNPPDYQLLDSLTHLITLGHSWHSHTLLDCRKQRSKNGSYFVFCYPNYFSILLCSTKVMFTICGESPVLG